MRIIFSIVGLLIVLAIIGFVAKQQLSAITAPASTAPAGTSAAPAPTPQQTVQQVKDDVQRSLAQGADRASEADR